MTVQERSIYTLLPTSLIGAALLLSGCGLEEVDDDGETEAIPAAVQQAFDESCATSVGCHASGASLVVLSAPESAAILSASSGSGGGPLVTFGDLERSYIAQKILGGSSILGGVMPPSKQSDNDDINAAIIVGWIAGVAIDDGGGDGDGDPTGDGDGDTACFIGAPLPASISFAEVWPILEGRCGTMGCHANLSPPLLPDQSAAYANLVDAPATSAMANYVEPGDPDGSYLWHKLVGTQSSVQGGGGFTMPVGGELCGIEFQAIYAWILAGAEQ
jgi:hypothetical protein